MNDGIARLGYLLSESSDELVFEGADVEIAKTIISQMGGSRVKTMAGARTFVAVPEGDSGGLGGVTFSFPNRIRSRGNAVKIVLMPDDTYTVTFYNGMKEVKSYDGVYNDSLIDVFERQTGVYLTINPRKQESQEDAANLSEGTPSEGLVLEARISPSAMFDLYIRMAAQDFLALIIDGLPKGFDAPKIQGYGDSGLRSAEGKLLSRSDVEGTYGILVTIDLKAPYFSMVRVTADVSIPGQMKQEKIFDVGKSGLFASEAIKINKWLGFASGVES
jgi:hypothetical protein